MNIFNIYENEKEFKLKIIHKFLYSKFVLYHYHNGVSAEEYWNGLHSENTLAILSLHDTLVCVYSNYSIE